MPEDEVTLYALPSNKPFDVIVPTHNNLGLTIECLDALYTNTSFPFHLIVVDDSIDLTPLYIRNFQKEHDNITYIHSDEPFKTGNQFFNRAFEKCKHEFVATVMNSVRVEPEWEIVALTMLENTPKIGTIGLKSLFASDGKIESAGIALVNFDQTFNATTDLGRGLPGHRLAIVRPVDAVQWALAIHRREAVYPLDEDVYYGFKGWDDLDNCFAIKQKGWEVYYCGMGCGYHKPRATRASSTADSLFQNRVNAEKFYKRWNMWEEFKKQYKLPDDYEGIKEGDEQTATDRVWKILTVADAHEG